MSESLVLVDEPVERVRRVTLNRPEKRNALNASLRRAILDTLGEHDADPDVSLTIVRGAGSCFSAGYDLNPGPDEAGDGYPRGGGVGSFQREVTEGWMSIWDLAKPVIAQVHGYCLAGGSELATGCDLVYAADDAQIGYPAVRFGTPDMQYHAWLLGMRRGMELMLTGDSISGKEAAEHGFATRSFPAEELEERVLDVATRISHIPSDVVQINKRTVHRAMAVMGMPDAIRGGTELSALAVHTEGFQAFMEARDSGGLVGALNQRDGQFGDYRTGHGT
ncbi:MAG: enoyl-CoA hydratase-related protein [Acidimicrobiales bacterium]|nr:enoyl-CoA hydratase-related protein [Acidimicrobiales bacterium]